MTDVLSEPPAVRRHARRRARMPRAAAFWVIAAATLIMLAASSAPSPLYPIYQRQFGFAPVTLTGIFAIYVLALLAGLLTVGRLSDFTGRRPVLAVALVVEAASMGIFFGANGVGLLMAARFVQGLATGAAIGVLGAYLLDLQPPGGSRLGSLVNTAAPTAGLGVGAIGTGLLVQYAPHPTRLVFAVLLGLLALLVPAVLALPETVERIPGALRSLRPRAAVPAAARRGFAGAVPTFVSSWALGGLMFSVGGSLMASVFGEPNEAVIGLVIGVFAFSGAVGALALSQAAPARADRAGVVALVVGAALFVVALVGTSFPVFVGSAVVAGAGFGMSFLGSLRSVTQLVEPHERASLLSAVYVVCYIAFSVPAVIAGLLITHLGLHDTALYYSAIVGLLALGRLVATLLPARAARGGGVDGTVRAAAVVAPEWEEETEREPAA